MREGNELVERENEIFRRDQLAERLARGLLRNFLDASPGEKRLRTARARQQHAAFLEGLAHSGDAEGARLVIEPMIAAAARVIGRNREILLVDAAAGEDERAGGEVDLVMAHHHEDFHALGAVAHQQHGRCGARRRDLLRRRRFHCKHVRLPASSGVLFDPIATRRLSARHAT